MDQLHFSMLKSDNIWCRPGYLYLLANCVNVRLWTYLWNDHCKVKWTPESVSNQLVVLNWSTINCVSFFHTFLISNYMIHNLLIHHQLSLLYANLIGWQWPQFAMLH